MLRPGAKPGSEHPAVTEWWVTTPVKVNRPGPGRVPDDLSLETLETPLPPAGSSSTTWNSSECKPIQQLGFYVHVNRKLTRGVLRHISVRLYVYANHSNLEKQRNQNSNSSKLKKEKRKGEGRGSSTGRAWMNGQFISSEPDFLQIHGHFSSYALSSRALPKQRQRISQMFLETTFPSKQASAGACADGHCKNLRSRGALWCPVCAITWSLGLETGAWPLGGKSWWFPRRTNSYMTGSTAFLRIFSAPDCNEMRA